MLPCAMSGWRTCTQRLPGRAAIPCPHSRRHCCLATAAGGTQDNTSSSSSSWQDIRKQYKSLLGGPSRLQQPAKPASGALKDSKKKFSTAKSGSTKGASSTTKIVKTPAASRNGTPAAGPAAPAARKQKRSEPDKPSKAAAPAAPITTTSSSRPQAAPGPQGFGLTPGLPRTGSSTARGFGAAAAAASEAAADASKLRLFLFAVEAKRVQSAIDGCGWSDRVAIVPSIPQASAIITCKLTPGGKHQNLVQGQRAAENAGIPFIVVGRNMTKDNLKSALAPLLDAFQPGSSSNSSSSSSSAAGAAASSSRGAAAGPGAVDDEAARKAEAQEYMEAALRWSQSPAAARAESLSAQVSVAEDDDDGKSDDR